MVETCSEPVTHPAPASGDVDDYIFKSEQDWWVSDR